jgi:hypothetical protein
MTASNSRASRGVVYSRSAIRRSNRPRAERLQPVRYPGSRSDPVARRASAWMNSQGTGSSRNRTPCPQLCAEPVGERWTPAQGRQPAVVRVDTRAIAGIRRGPTRRARVRPRPPEQSLCPLDAWRTLRDEPWRRYRHQVTTTEERVRLAGGLGLSRKSRPTTHGHGATAVGVAALLLAAAFAQPRNSRTRRANACGSRMGR